MIEIVYCSLIVLAGGNYMPVTLKGHVIQRFPSQVYGKPDELLVDFEYEENREFLPLNKANVRIIPENLCTYGDKK